MKAHKQLITPCIFPCCSATMYGILPSAHRASNLHNFTWIRDIIEKSIVTVTRSYRFTLCKRPRVGYLMSEVKLPGCKGLHIDGYYFSFEDVGDVQVFSHGGKNKSCLHSSNFMVCWPLMFICRAGGSILSQSNRDPPLKRW